MPRNKSLSHERIIKSAKKEFLEKGFEKSSMREIGRLAGMTQAALYRHYKSKEDMFISLVNPAIDALKEAYEIHAETAYNMVDKGLYNEFFINNNVAMFKNLYLNYRIEFKLLLCCSQGTKYENFIPDLVNYQQKEMLKVLNYLKEKNYTINHIDEDELHLLLSAYITAIFEPIIYDWSDVKISHSINVITNFFIPGWKKVMGL